LGPAFAQSPFQAIITGTSQLTLAIMGIGAIIAIVGGVMYLTVVLLSVLTGQRQEATRLRLVMSQANPLVEDAIPASGRDFSHKEGPRGTLVLVFSFLAFFMLYYFSNWWLLGRSWIIR
jgi:cytochrome c oxidase subunit 1